MNRCVAVSSIRTVCKIADPNLEVGGQEIIKSSHVGYQTMKIFSFEVHLQYTPYQQDAGKYTPNQ